MSYYYGYGRRPIRFQDNNFGKRLDEIEKKLKKLSIKDHEYEYKTVFDINIKTATKTFNTINGKKKLTVVRNGKYCLFQEHKDLGPTFGDDYIENKGTNYMLFNCPEFMYGNVSVFIVCAVADTSVTGSWCYLIGNDNGSYDKFMAFKAYNYSHLTIGGIEGNTDRTIILPSNHSILHKHILSCHWMGRESCLYANAVKIPNSDFKADLTDIGSPFGSVFFNERFNSFTSAVSGNILKGKIFGFKIVEGLLTPEDIIKINKDMMIEYGNFV